MSCRWLDQISALTILKKQLKGNKIIGEIEYIEPLKNNKEENINKTINWIKNL